MSDMNKEMASCIVVMFNLFVYFCGIFLWPIYLVYIFYFGYTKFLISRGLPEISYAHMFVFYIMLSLLSFVIFDKRNIKRESNEDDLFNVSKIILLQGVVYTVYFLILYLVEA